MCLKCEAVHQASGATAPFRSGRPGITRSGRWVQLSDRITASSFFQAGDTEPALTYANSARTTGDGALAQVAVEGAVEDSSVIFEHHAFYIPYACFIREQGTV